MFGVFVLLGILIVMYTLPFIDKKKEVQGKFFIPKPYRGGRMYPTEAWEKELDKKG